MPSYRITEMMQAEDYGGIFILIFISHSSKDYIEVMKWVERIESIGIDCWISERDLPENVDIWSDEIRKALMASDTMILFTTHNSIESPEVFNEITFASDHKVNIIPLIVEEVQFSERVLYYIRKYEWINTFRHSNYQSWCVLKNRLLEGDAGKGTSFFLNSSSSSALNSDQMNEYFTMRFFFTLFDIRYDPEYLVEAEELYTQYLLYCNSEKSLHDSQLGNSSSLDIAVFKKKTEEIYNLLFESIHTHALSVWWLVALEEDTSVENFVKFVEGNSSQQIKLSVRNREFLAFILEAKLCYEIKEYSFVARPNVYAKRLAYAYRKLTVELAKNVDDIRIFVEHLIDIFSIAFYNSCRPSSSIDAIEGKLLESFKNQNQLIFSSDNTLEHFITSLDTYYSSKEYIDKAVELCRCCYGELGYLSYADQFFPDIIIPSGVNIILDGTPISEYSQVISRINCPEHFSLVSNRISDCWNYEGIIVETMVTKTIHDRIMQKIRKNSTGFTRHIIKLDELGQLVDMNFRVGKYLDNIITTEILTWEIAAAYNGEPLSIRKRIIEKAGEGINSLLDGRWYQNMVGLQCVIVFKNTHFNDYYPEYSDNPDSLWTLLIKRSNKVYEKVSSYQFAGAGSFTTVGTDHPNADLIKRSFSIFSSLKAEYTEEVFAYDEANTYVGNQGENMYFLDAIKRGLISVEFLGLSVAMDTLKTDMVYLIIVDDPSFCDKKFKSNYEDVNEGPIIMPLDHVKEFLIEESVIARELVGPLSLLKYSKLLSK